MANLVVDNYIMYMSNEIAYEAVSQDILYWQTEYLENDPTMHQAHLHLNPEHDFTLKDVELLLKGV